MKDDSFDCTLIAHLCIFLLFYRLLYCLILPENRLFFGIWKVVEIVLVFMPNGFISAINAIKMKQLSVWELMIMSFLSFVPMWIVIEDIVLGMISW